MECRLKTVEYIYVSLLGSQQKVKSDALAPDIWQNTSTCQILEGTGLNLDC